MEIRRETDENGVMTITLDDGAKNALTPDSMTELVAVLDGLGDEVRAVVLAGNGSIFTPGLDVKLIASGGAPMTETMIRGLGETAMRIWGEPRPTVAACTGHSLAAGTMLAMACDHAVAADGAYKWGLSETLIGFQMPRFGIELARGNVRSDKVDDLLLPGAMVDPATAVEVGFADELAPLDEVLTVAHARATALARLDGPTYAGTKRRLRGETIDRVLATIVDDVRTVVGEHDFA